MQVAVEAQAGRAFVGVGVRCGPVQVLLLDGDPVVRLVVVFALGDDEQQVDPGAAVRARDHAGAARVLADLPAGRDEPCRHAGRHAVAEGRGSAGAGRSVICSGCSRHGVAIHPDRSTSPCGGSVSRSAGRSAERRRWISTAGPLGLVEVPDRAPQHLQQVDVLCRGHTGGRARTPGTVRGRSGTSAAHSCATGTRGLGAAWRRPSRSSRVHTGHGSSAGHAEGAADVAVADAGRAPARVQPGRGPAEHGEFGVRGKDLRRERRSDHEDENSSGRTSQSGKNAQSSRSTQPRDNRAR